MLSLPKDLLITMLCESYGNQFNRFYDCKKIFGYIWRYFRSCYTILKPSQFTLRVDQWKDVVKDAQLMLDIIDYSINFLEATTRDTFWGRAKFWAIYKFNWFIFRYYFKFEMQVKYGYNAWFFTLYFKRHLWKSSKTFCK